MSSVLSLHFQEILSLQFIPLQNISKEKDSFLQLSVVKNLYFLKGLDL